MDYGYYGEETLGGDLVYPQAVHVALEGIGLIPGAEPADAVNAALYTLEGDWENALWSGGSSIPVGGWLANLGKWLRRGADGAKPINELAQIGFRADTSHIFRNATGHLAEDTAENRALIKSAVDPANLRGTVTSKDGGSLQKYFRELPDGTQAWAEVRNGEITNGGLNVIPR